MARRVKPYWIAALLATLTGCSVFERPQRPAWRGQEEAACLANKQVKASEFLRPVGAVEGRGICGMDHGFKVSAFSEGSVTLERPIILACPMIAEVDAWLAGSVQPAAQARFGVPVVGFVSAGGYSCRNIDNKATGKLSEHAFGNAVDIGGFRLADGRVVTVKKDWGSFDEQTRAFLRDAFDEGCGEFTTALGPGEPYHSDHFHLDLAHHGQTAKGPRRYCNPKPLPERAPLPTTKSPPEYPPPDEIDVASGGSGLAPIPGRLTPALALSAPPPLSLRRPALAPFAAPARPAEPLALAPPPRQPKSGVLREDGAFDPNFTSSIRPVAETARER